eukprot:CAMPEP_0116126750 /NCGR_PEP_ID=MMETSP0329-20121206/6491_1 /TAXON_ID=697910 /ORGANISM="Pseudo-nitzschia arenysensis, Strain B593" /LENGTH=317 /DNA_ID=CAMNT_0003620839 /DNA_START=332 /DNA_END=1282 /DNA_ORIENTATION=-
MADYKRNRGGLSFWRMMRPDREAGVHKIAALLLYFFAGMELEGTKDDSRIVEFHHLKGKDDSKFDALLRNNHDVLIDSSRSNSDGGVGSTKGDGNVVDRKFGHVRLHSERMEAVGTPSGFVNFANDNFGYGKFIPSCTQEEILQICCPEFNIGMLFLAVLADDETVNVYNCRRFCSYTGYLKTFRCLGQPKMKPNDAPQIHHILTMDACFTRHYTKENVLRDTRKAYTSFAALVDYTTQGGGGRNKKSNKSGTISISSGKWGCGVFGGTPSHKLLQQVLAAKLAGAQLHFSTFGNNESCDTLLEELERRQETVSGGW